MIQREGRLVETIFHNEENGYRVCLLECESELLTVVGVMPGVHNEDRIRVTGRIKKHRRYGEQLHVETIEPLLPENPEGIIAYLGSGLLPGVGRAMAGRILETFGTKVFDVLANQPERLTEVKGIGSRRWPAIAAAYSAHHSFRVFLIWMGDQGVETSIAMKLYQTLGDSAREILQSNPYQILDTIPEIGFFKADKIARSMGIEAEDSRRLESGLMNMLWAMQREGHTCVPQDELIEISCQTLDAGEKAMLDSLLALAYDQRIFIAPREDDVPMIYLKDTFEAETECAKYLAVLAGSNPPAVPDRLENLLEEIQSKQHIQLAEAQQSGILAAFHHRILVITGGPGTGKTTLINTLIGMLEALQLRYLLGAPTGRAAKRMTETSGREAKTLHRMLEISYAEERKQHFFHRDEENPLEADVVIVDEASMVDIFMMQFLLRAVGPGTTLVMTGDADQLPSVGPGSVLKDMTSSELIPVIHLTEIFRQAQESHIILNAHRINQGDPPLLNHRDKDFFFIDADDPQTGVITIEKLLVKRLNGFRGFDPMRDIQVLSPTKKGLTGTKKLNELLQQVMNPPSENRREMVHGQRVFREGDRVMQTRNNYSQAWRRTDNEGILSEPSGYGVFNGDLGKVEKINHETENVTVLFDDDRSMVYPFDLLEELEPAWAITVHKSQGSEFPVVIMPVFPAPWVLMTRNLLYTAVTRARVMVILVGSRRVLHRMIENNRIQYRHSELSRRLRRIGEFHALPDELCKE